MICWIHRRWTGGLIEGTPADDRRMIAIALQDLGPLIDVVGIVLRLKVVAPVGKLTPDQVTQLVRPVEEARLEDFLVQPGAVVTGGHAHLDVVLQRFVRRRGPDAIRIKTLVQDQPLEDPLAVDQDAPGLRWPPCASRSNCALHPCFSLPRYERELQSRTETALPAPRVSSSSSFSTSRLSRHDAGAGILAHHLAVGERLGGQRQVRVSAVDRRLNQHARMIGIGHDGEGFDEG